MTKISVAALAGVVLAGCVPAPGPGTSAPEWLVGPADPARAGPDRSYVDVTRGVTRFRVVEPKDWRAQNRAVGPRGAGQSKGPSEGPSKPGAGMGDMDMGGMDRRGRRDTGGR